MKGSASSRPTMRIGHVHLKVADLERAVAFYRDVLGFEVTQRMGDSAAFLSADGYHHHLGLNTWEKRRRLTSSARQHRPLSPGHSLPEPVWSSPAPCAACSTTASGWTARRTTASARRSTCATPTETGWNYRDREPAEWPRAEGSLAMGSDPLDVQDLLGELDRERPGRDGAVRRNACGSRDEAR